MVANNACNGATPTFEEICPVVDINKQPTEIFTALKQRGFCYVTGTGITDKMVHSMCMSSQQFWSLPRDKKMAYKQGQDVTFSGYIPSGVHRPTANTPQHLLKETLFDYKEAFDMMHPEHKHCVIPDYPESAAFFDEAYTFFTTISAVGKRIVDIVADSMDDEGEVKRASITRQAFQKLCTAENCTYMRMAYYPGNDKRSQAKGVDFGKNTNRIGIHRDSAPFVAMIASPDLTGLQVEDNEYGWYDVRPLPAAKDAIWIHVGQLGYHITDGALQQPLLHKVTLPDDPSAPDRYSIVHFLGADADATIPAMSSGEGRDLRNHTGFEWVSLALSKAEKVYSDMKTGKKENTNGVITNGHTNGCAH